MEFLKEIFGNDELYGKVEAAVKAWNENEANKDNQIKLGNLGTGEYVGKAKYDAIQEALTGKETELTGANDLIAQLKKSTKDDEGMQEKISTYESENTRLKEENEKIRLESAIKVALLAEKAVDVDFLAYKIQSGDQKPMVDENGNLKDWDAIKDNLKKQHPKMFESSTTEQVIENTLPPHKGDGETEPKNLADALKQRYEKE